MNIVRFILLAMLGLLYFPANALDAPLAGDAHISNQDPTANFGGSPNLAVGPGILSLLRFSLSTLPPGTSASNVTKASLMLYVNQTSGGKVDLFPLVSDFNESTVSMANPPFFMPYASGPSTTVPVAGQFLVLDVTAQVQGAVVNQAASIGFAIAPARTTPGTTAYFDSKENLGTGHAARLDITLGGQGQQGIQGLKGDKGDKGDKGLTGDKGVAGGKGDKGDKGDKGLTGDKGVAGAKGDTGPQGQQGIPGPAVRTVAICQNAAPGGASCSSKCSKTPVVSVVQPNNCTVTSDTGSCSAGAAGGANALCCVCQP